MSWIIPNIIINLKDEIKDAAGETEALEDRVEAIEDDLVMDPIVAAGNPISVNGVATIPAEALSMTISPTQSLNGYDKPWAGGAGRNKAKVSSTLAEITVNGITFTPQSDGSIVVNGKCNNATAALVYTNYNYGEGFGATLEDQFAIMEKAIPNGSYIANATDSNGYILMQVSTYNSSSDAGRVYNSARGGSFSVDDTYAYNNIRFLLIAPVGFEYNNYVIYPMIRLATETDATFAPYTNICPITGITTATVQTTDGETTNTASMELGETVYAGSVDFNAGSGTSTMANIDSYAGETINEPWLSSMDEYVSGATPTTGAQVVYTLATPTTLTLTASTLTLLEGEQTVSGNGEEITISMQPDNLIGDLKKWILNHTS